MSAVSPYRAISDHTRRQILDLLRGENLTAGAIAGHFGEISRPAVSKHLAILRKSRLVQVRKQGREQVYTLNAAPLREVNAWLSRYEAFWDDQLAAFKHFVEGQLPPEEHE
jgi:DNA-binding transcriptional ArsR family regulator